MSPDTGTLYARVCAGKRKRGKATTINCLSELVSLYVFVDSRAEGELDTGA